MSSFKRLKLKNKNAKNTSSDLMDKSRKEVRKELRKQKKINKAIYFQQKNKLLGSGSDKDERIVKVHGEKNICNDDIVDTIEIQKKSVQKKKTRKVELEKRNIRNESLKQANFKEDRIIKTLEKQLKLNKRKKKTIPKSFALDGLDYLLDFCVEKNRRYIVETEEKLLTNKFDDEFEVNFKETVEEDPSEKNTCMENELHDIKENKKKNKNVNDHSATTAEESFTANENVIELDSKVSETEEVKLEQSKKNVHINNNDGLWEDIYGRKRDRNGNIIQNANRYVPPAAKVVSDINSHNDKLQSLKKQLKGYLNRITEHNIHYISNQIETMYMTNSRNNMNLVLSKLTLESLVTNVMTPNRLVCEHMMLIAILHANVGTEVGASFLEKLVKTFFEIIKKPQDVENKELDNIILMLSHLYNFKMYGHKLIYQILNKLATKFTEKEIELILLILKTVGFSLRKDDPNALKEFIKNLQQKASHENGKNSSRVKFMLEILLAVKNNNINKLPQYDPFELEHLRKVMKNVIRKGNAIVQFNVTLEDLLYADENGKWWIIGSAWSGTNTIDISTETNKHNKLNFGTKILELAKKQRMNTDTRRNIFCILVTAEDYLDAFEKLHHLGLKDQQEGEIIHVLMHCCLQENKFNPYYAILAQKLCEYNRKYQLTIQYTLWDKLKTLETYESKQLNNLAHFLTYLFIENCLALSILKIIQFTELDKHTMKFLKQIILKILLHENEKACLRVFERISVSTQLQTFIESLRLFINCFIIKNIDSNSILDEQKLLLKKRVELVDKILILHGSKVMF